MNELSIETHGTTRVLRINREARMNSVSLAVGKAINLALTQADRDPAVRTIVLTGTGSAAFCAGGDLMEKLEPNDGAQRPRPVSTALAHLPSKPLIAAVNGLAFGGGMELVLACDLAIAAEHATFALPEVKRGLMATGGGLTGLPRVVGLRRAMQLILSGEPISAAVALDWGLVNQVVESDDLLPTTLELANTIGSNAPLAVTASKELLRAAAWSDEEEALRMNQLHHVRINGTEDAVEGRRAFADKREPRWTGS